MSEHSYIPLTDIEMKYLASGLAYEKVKKEPHWEIVKDFKVIDDSHRTGIDTKYGEIHLCVFEFNGKTYAFPYDVVGDDGEYEYGEEVFNGNTKAFEVTLKTRNVEYYARNDGLKIYDY